MAKHSLFLSYNFATDRDTALDLMALLGQIAPNVHIVPVDPKSDRNAAESELVSLAMENCRAVFVLLTRDGIAQLRSGPSGSSYQYMELEHALKIRPDSCAIILGPGVEPSDWAQFMPDLPGANRLPSVAFSSSPGSENADLKSLVDVMFAARRMQDEGDGRETRGSPGMMDILVGGDTPSGKGGLSDLIGKIGLPTMTGMGGKVMETLGGILGGRSKSAERMQETSGDDLDPISRSPASGGPKVGEVIGTIPAPSAPQRVTPVQGRVFSRETVKPERETIVQFVVHTAEQTDAVRSNARDADPKAAEQVAKALSDGVAEGDDISAHLQIRGAQIDIPVQNQTWNGAPLAFDFGVVAPEAGFEELMAKIIVSRNGDAFGSLRWMIREHTSDAPAVEEPEEQAELDRYQKAFLSYSSKDRAEVLKRAQGMRAMNVEVFLDRFSLVPGEKFQDHLDRNIKGADLFVLCWSENAKKSEWVQKETVWASEQYERGPEHRPDLTAVILEQNPPPPPPEFADRHMTDVLNDMIKAAEDLAKERAAAQT